MSLPPPNLGLDCQPVDLACREGNFWNLKNAAEIGWVTQMQAANPKNCYDYVNGKVQTASINFSQMLSYLRVAWPAGFSSTRNNKAWTHGGFGPRGMDMRPLWREVQRENASSKGRQRPLSMSEVKRKIAQEGNLADNYKTCVPPII